MSTIIKEAAEHARLTDPVYRGRVDLALSSGETLVVVEFMRPGLKLDWDHLGRLEQYVRMIKSRLTAETGVAYGHFQGLVVADRLDDTPHLRDKLAALKNENNLIRARSWSQLPDDAKSAYQDYLDILIRRGEGDARMAALQVKNKGLSVTDLRRS